MAFKPQHCLKAVCSAHLVIFSTLIPFLPLLSTLPSLLFAVSLFSKPHLLFLCVTQKTHTHIHRQSVNYKERAHREPIGM